MVAEAQKSANRSQAVWVLALLALITVGIAMFAFLR
jgi:hypothetical protein